MREKVINSCETNSEREKKGNDPDLIGEGEKRKTGERDQSPSIRIPIIEKA